ncbi:MAG: hypothetical protein WBU92_09765 [Candidatus Dormiibacterota bacterium]
MALRMLGVHRSVIWRWLGPFPNGGRAVLEVHPVLGRPSKPGQAETERLTSVLISTSAVQLRSPLALWTRTTSEEVIW